MNPNQLPVVVVGAGVAGMATALAAAPADVLLLCREEGDHGSASAMAQGGIAAAVGEGDTPAAHAADTIEAGARHNDADAVRWLCDHAPATVAWLAAQGVVFDRDADGRLQLGREGGHGTHRIVHSGGDATGAALVRALRAQVDASEQVRWRGGADVDALLLRDGHVCGVRIRDAQGHGEEIEAAAVVLATGGIGAAFAHTSNPSGADGAGLALALAAGARPRDLEFVQFHPTALAVDGHSLPLLTEALRGAGAHLHDGDGRPLMAGLHPLGDLAPRDVVARRVWQTQQAGGSAWLDATSIEGAWERRFPTVLAACLRHGFDPRTERLPVTPVAHFHMGGVATNLDGHTSLPGLYAVGEVACNGVHGANRLASNSLLEGVACGRRLGKLLASVTAASSHGAHHWIERGTPLPAPELPALRQTLWRSAGPLRDPRVLAEARQACAGDASRGWQMRFASILLQAAERRSQSLGAHFLAAPACRDAAAA